MTMDVQVSAREVAAMHPLDKVGWVYDLIEAIQRSTPRTKANEEAFGALQAAKHVLSVFLALAEEKNELAVFEAGAALDSLSTFFADKGSIGRPIAEALALYRARTGY